MKRLASKLFCKYHSRKFNVLFRLLTSVDEDAYDSLCHIAVPLLFAVIKFMRTYGAAHINFGPPEFRKLYIGFSIWHFILILNPLHNDIWLHAFL